MRPVCFLRLAVLTLAGSLTVGLAPLAHAKRCTAATLFGMYGFQE
jgi:hypothetical protein